MASDHDLPSASAGSDPAPGRVWAWLRRSSIRRKILGIIFVSGIVPIIVVLLLARLGMYRMVDAGVAQFLMDRGETLSNTIDGSVARRMAGMLFLVRDPNTQALFAQASSELVNLREDLVLAQLQRAGADYLFDPQGRLVVGAPDDSTLEPRLRAGIKELNLNSPEQVSVLEHFVSGAPSGWLLLLGPVANASGEIVGIIVDRVPLQEAIGPLLPAAMPDHFITIVNRSGLYIAGEPLTRERQQEFSSLVAADPDASEGWGRQSTSAAPHQIMTYRRLRLFGALASSKRSEGDWYLLGGYALGALLGDIEFQLWRIGLIGLVSVSLFLGLGLVLAHRIIRPLRLLRREVEEISAGRLEQRLDVHTNDELEDLATNINLMAARLAATHDDLESKITMLHEQTDQLETLRGITRTITEAFERSELLDTFEREVARLVEFEAIWIALVAGRRKRLEIIHSAWKSGDPPLGLQPNDTLTLRDSRLGRAVTEERAILEQVGEPTAADPSEDVALRSGGLRSLLVIPLRSPQGIIGTLGLGSVDASRFTEEHVRLLGHAAEQLAIGLEHARLYAELRELASVLEDKVAARTAELQIAQRRLFQTEKFAATGRLAANVAHEINNPLGIIKNYLRLLSDGLRGALGGRRTSDPKLDQIKIIEEEIDRIARTMRNLLSFYRPSPPGSENREVQINDEIEAILRLVEGGLEKRRIHLEVAMCQELPTLRCSPDLVRQVFLNLIRNAEDAMTDMPEGELTVTTDLEPTARGHRIVATVSDTGHGIAPEHLDQIFDPFFTTKDETGTGLGLAVTFSIVEALGGTIEVDSTPNEGTSFILTFPVAPNRGI